MALETVPKEDVHNSGGRGGNRVRPTTLTMIGGANPAPEMRREGLQVAHGDLAPPGKRGLSHARASARPREWMGRPRCIPGLTFDARRNRQRRTRQRTGAGMV